MFRAQEYAKTKAADCSPLPSLVVCPPTLTGHWVDEVGKFCTKEYLHPLHYTGPPSERMRWVPPSSAAACAQAVRLWQSV